jgi:hypothetical protein
VIGPAGCRDAIRAALGRRAALLLAAAVLASLALGATLAAAVAPTVTVEDASEVSYQSAKVAGAIDPQGLPTTYRFQYATQADFSDAATGVEEVTEAAGPVSGGLTGLAPATTYHLRLLAENADGPAEAAAAKTFTTLAVAKPAVTIAPVTEVTATTAEFAGTVDPQGADPAFDANWHFEISTDDAAWTELEGHVPLTGSGAQSVSEVTKGLLPNQHYFVRLVASNAGGSTASAGPDPSFDTPASAPTAIPTYPTNASATAITLRAFVNPNHSALTECHFDYGLTAAYGQSVPCSPDPGSANELTEVSAGLSGLTPTTEYHYRLVTANQGGPATFEDRIAETLATPQASACPNLQFHTGNSANLPDCRAYEMVSPPDKNGADIIGVSDRTRAATDGSAVQFGSLIGFGDAAGTAISVDYMSVRDEAPRTNGWHTHAITPNLEPVALGHQLFANGFDQIYKGEFSADLEKGALISATPLTDGHPNNATVPNLYLRTNLRSSAPGAYELLSDCPGCTGPLPGIATAQPAIAGASADFSHVLIESSQSLTSDVPPCDPGASSTNCEPHLYEWDSGTVRLAGVLPASEGGAAAPSSQAGQGALDGNYWLSEYTPNTMSQDGSRIFFTVRQNSQVGQLYLRTNNGTPEAATVRINASEQTALDPCQAEPMTCPEARYSTATPDGSKSFFTTKEKLVDDDTSDPNILQLYMYDTDSPADQHLTRLSSDTAVPKGVVGTSDDGDYVYFYDSAGKGIYLWHNGAVRKVAAVLDETYILATGGWELTTKASRVSPDGKRIVFVSVGSDELPHTGAGDGCPANEGCEEVYLYDATANGGAGELTCVSCHVPANSPSQTDASFISRVGRGVAGRTSHLNHPLSDDGRYVFFSTGDRLVPEDTNGTFDVYEYDALTGEQHLISSGESKAGSYFMDASADGSNVFFRTNERLSGWDVDGAFDLYDARANGGLPEPPPAPPSCTGDACQPPPIVPNDPTPSSSSFSGPGNPKAAKKRQHKKRQHKKRSHKRHSTHRNG